MTGLFKSLMAAFLLLSAPSAFAHGLLMQAEGKGTDINGTLYYSNGQRAGGEWIELFDAAKPDEALQTIQTHEDGSFHLTGQQGRAYRIRATGEEGHEITIALTLKADEARGKMVADPRDKAGEESEIPAWAVLGGLLALSAIPAYWLRRRGRATLSHENGASGGKK